MNRLCRLSFSALAAFLTTVLAVSVLSPGTPASGGLSASAAYQTVASSQVSASSLRTVRLHNPSFEAGTQAWRAVRGQISVGRSLDNVEGQRAGVVRWGRGKRVRAVRYFSRASVGAAGDVVKAKVTVAAGSRTARRDKVRLIAVERRKGRTVAVHPGPIRTLRARPRQISVKWTVENAGAKLELRAVQRHVRPGKQLRLDAATVAMTPANQSQPPNMTPAQSPTTSLGLLSIREGQAPYWNDTSRYRYVVGFGWEYRRVSQVKSQNPNTDMLLYLEAGATQYRSDCKQVRNPASFQEPRASWGIDFCWLQANGYDDWILRDASGRYLEYKDYPGFLAMDMGNPAYARQWAKNADGAVREFGFDGVWADDINTSIGHGHQVSYRKTARGLQKVPNSEYGAGTLNWVRDVRGYWNQLNGGRLTLAANVFAVPWEDPGADQALIMARYLDVYSREHQSQWLTGHQCDPYLAQEPNAINATMNFAEKVQQAGAGYVTIDYGTDPVSRRDRQIMAFGRSMFLMTWNGDPRGAYFYRPCGSRDASDPEWTTELGRPLGPREVLRRESFWRAGDRWESTGYLLRRRYEGGLVLQNQLPRSMTVQLSGRYRLPSGKVVTEVTLPGSRKAVRANNGSVIDQGSPGSGVILAHAG